MASSSLEDSLRTWASLVLLLAVCATAMPVRGDPLRDGLAAAQQRDYRRAVTLLTSALDGSGLAGKRRAQALEARGVCRVALLDEARAADDFEEALALVPDLAESNYRFGTMHATGFGTYPDVHLAVTLLTRAAEQDHRGAQRELARLYLTRELYDPRQSHEWLMRAAWAGDARAQRMLGVRYETGSGLIKNPDEAFRWFLKAAEQGDPPAQYQVAMAYRQGTGVAADAASYRDWMQRAADGGYRDAGFRVGEIYEEGQGVVARDLRRGAYWFWRAAEQLHQAAAVRLGIDYLRGWGLVSDFRNALYWFERAGADPRAHYYRGLIREKGLHGDANPEQAFQFYSAAAERGVVEAVVKTGMMYMSGLGVKADTKEGAKYIRALGNLDSASALNAAAWMLATDENDSLRSGKLAGTLIHQAISKADERADLLDTQAAAYAESGNFRKAVKSERKALKMLREESYRPEMERHLAQYEEKRPWRERFVAGREELSKGSTWNPGAPETRFTGTIVRIRAAQGVVDPGIFVDRKPTHVLEIAIQKVTSGRLPFGQQERLVLFLADPARYYPDGSESTAVTDYPVALQQFSLDEVKSGGWHYVFRILPSADR